MRKVDISIVEKYLNEIKLDKFHRYKSWDHCFEVFKENKPTDYHSLELGFYLASWGMYRGSSGLLQKNHLIHDKAIQILFSDKYQTLKCNENNEITADSIGLIFDLKNELGAHYKSIVFTRGANEKSISDTDTLISKIMLGTFACVPAYDQYFIEGLKEMKMEHSKLSTKSLNELFDFIEDNEVEIGLSQQSAKEKTQMNYPVMKIIDMYFWQLGFDNRMKKKK